MSEGTPVTSVGGFDSVSQPTILPQKKAPEYFAGCRLYDVTNDEYNKLMRGSKKYERWNKYFDDTEKGTQAHTIKRYLYKNPGKSVVLRNLTSQEMVYFKPKGKEV